MTTHYLLQLFISGLVIGSIYSAVALGFVIIYKATRVVNFAPGEFLMLGAYVCYAFLVPMHVPFWDALALTIAFGLWLWLQWFKPATGWLHAKIALVALLAGYHLWCWRLMRAFAEERNTRSHVWFRWFNEIPTIILFATVLLVVLKPF